MTNIKFKRLLYLFITLLLILDASAFLTQNEFSDGTTAFNTTTNITKYINLPTSAIILNASISIQGYPIYNFTTNSSYGAFYEFYSGFDGIEFDVVGSYVSIKFSKPNSDLFNFSFVYSSHPTNPNSDVLTIYCNTSTETNMIIGNAGVNPPAQTRTFVYQFYKDTSCASKNDIEILIMKTYGAGSYPLRFNSVYMTNYTYTNFTSSLINNFSIKLFVNNTQIYNNTLVNGTYTNISLNKSLIQNFVQSTGTVPITFNFTTEGGMLSVYDLDIDYQSILDLSIYDETTDKLITEPTTVEIISDDLSFILNRTTVAGKLNITSLPQNEYKIRYYSDSYRTRSYFVDIGVTAVSLDLFNINTTTSSFIVVEVTDERGQPVVNAIVKMYKRFINRGAVELPVEMEQTDYEGKAGFYVELYTTDYSFIVEDTDGSIIFVSAAPTKITGDIIYLPASRYPSSYVTVSQTLEVTTTILFNNDTQMLLYTWNDPNTVLDEVCFNLTKTVNFVTTPLTYQCSNSYSGIISLNLTGILQNNTHYYAVGVVNINNQFAYSEWDYFNNNRQKNLGKEGLFISWMIIVTLFLIGIGINYGVAIGYTLLGMIMLQVLEVSYFSTGLISLIGIIGIIIAILNKQ